MSEGCREAQLNATAREVLEAERAWARAWHGKRKPNLKDDDKAEAIAAYEAATRRVADARAAWAELHPGEAVMGQMDP